MHGEPNLRISSGIVKPENVGKSPFIENHLALVYNTT